MWNTYKELCSDITNPPSPQVNFCPEWTREQVKCFVLSFQWQEQQMMHGVLEASHQRHQHTVAKMGHTRHVRAILDAVLVIQREYRAWKLRCRTQPLLQLQRTQELRRQQWAAIIIQRAWRSHYGQQLLISARKLLHHKMKSDLLRNSGHDWTSPLPNYSRKTLISGQISMIWEFEC